jgi:hypothetical protein
MLSPQKNRAIEIAARSIAHPDSDSEEETHDVRQEEVKHARSSLQTLALAALPLNRTPAGNS